ncbi:MAG TPA: type II toxin-antitoxin system PemK/MazF family toxin, partial [Aeromicrobium sp.]|nr:type II toxin-antitoxin system PemK/MazF family toxin [Aeromicrobium sp.]
RPRLVTEPTGVSVRPGDVYWLRPDATVGREQAGRRPFVIVAPATYLELVDSLALGVPISMTDRGWPNHVPIEIAGLSGFAMTEQLRTISRSRFDGHAGRIDEETFGEIREWLADYLGF